LNSPNEPTTVNVACTEPPVGNEIVPVTFSWVGIPALPVAPPSIPVKSVAVVAMVRELSVALIVTSGACRLRPEKVTVTSAEMRTATVGVEPEKVTVPSTSIPVAVIAPPPRRTVPTPSSVRLTTLVSTP
jgi:hypothetical protein